jgi:thiamine biosynthesis lipoprotein
MTMPRARTGSYASVRVREEHRSITLPAGTRIDLGGMGKGYAVDAAIALLGRGANAIVNASGDLYAAGPGPAGEGWLVGVEDPFAPSHDIAVLRVRDAGVATSGTGRKNWRAHGHRYHHLIDPPTGHPSESEVLAITVVAPTATAADVLATSAYLAGAAGGLRMIESLPDTECIIITEDGSVLASRGVEGYLA